MRIWGRFVAVVLMLLATTAISQERDVKARPRYESSGGGEKWAVIVGVNEYDDPNILPLKYAVSDAQALYDLLTDPNQGGFERDNVILLTDDTEPMPTRTEILRALTTLRKAVSPTDTVFLSFSGHGIEQDGIAYLIPRDGVLDILADEAISMERFYQAFGKASVQVAFLDACHSGISPPGGKNTDERMGKRMADSIFADATGRVVLSSCYINEKSWEYPEKKHGVFSYFLLEGLKGKADSGGDGYVTVSEVNSYVTQKVKAWAFQNRKQQTPNQKIEGSGEILLTMWEPPEAVVSPKPVVSSDVSREKPARQVTEKTKIGKDGAEMVLIPAGEFQMGSNDGSSDEKPVHTVYVDAFYMDKYEVTNALYKKFMDATGHKAPLYWNDSKNNAPDQPVRGVSWHDGAAYAKWAGKCLPTEAEWEKAARGGLSGKKYPWGDELTHDDANYSGTGGRDRWGYTSPVGSFDPNGYGLHDMTGNVWEWCADEYSSSYYRVSERNNPEGPGVAVTFDNSDFTTVRTPRVLRGGSCYVGNLYGLRVADRHNDNPTRALSIVGFRCAGL